MTGGPRKNDDLAGVGNVRVVDEQGEMLGVMSVEQALAIARGRQLDLVEVNPKIEPPMCKIVDLKKFDYAATRDAARGRKARREI